MLQLLLAPEDQGSFLAALARYARPPMEVHPIPGGLQIRGAEPTDVAAALTLGVFPRYERACLEDLLARNFAAFLPEERQLMLELAPQIIGRAAGKALYAGYDRPLRLAKTLAQLLQGGGLDFNGFCRFRLRGHTAFLHYVLTLAADEVLSREEDREYARLLRAAAVPPPGRGLELHLFFSSPSRCRIWERTEAGIRDREGGTYQGAEATFTANVIAMTPSKLVIHHPDQAEPVVLRHLEQAFGPTLTYALEPVPEEQEKIPTVPGLTKPAAGDIVIGNSIERKR